MRFDLLAPAGFLPSFIFGPIPCSTNRIQGRHMGLGSGAG